MFGKGKRYGKRMGSGIVAVMLVVVMCLTVVPQTGCLEKYMSHIDEMVVGVKINVDEDTGDVDVSGMVSSASLKALGFADAEELQATNQAGWDDYGASQSWGDEIWSWFGYGRGYDPYGAMSYATDDVGTSVKGMTYIQPSDGGVYGKNGNAIVEAVDNFLDVFGYNVFIWKLDGIESSKDTNTMWYMRDGYTPEVSFWSDTYAIDVNAVIEDVYEDLDVNATAESGLSSVFPNFGSWDNDAKLRAQATSIVMNYLNGNASADEINLLGKTLTDTHKTQIGIKTIESVCKGSGTGTYVSLDEVEDDMWQDSEFPDWYWMNMGGKYMWIYDGTAYIAPKSPPYTPVFYDAEWCIYTAPDDEVLRSYERIPDINLVSNQNVDDRCWYADMVLCSPLDGGYYYALVTNAMKEAKSYGSISIKVGLCLSSIVLTDWGNQAKLFYESMPAGVAKLNANMTKKAVGLCVDVEHEFNAMYLTAVENLKCAVANTISEALSPLYACDPFNILGEPKKLVPDYTDAQNQKDPRGKDYDTALRCVNLAPSFYPITYDFIYNMPKVSFMRREIRYNTLSRVESGDTHKYVDYDLSGLTHQQILDTVKKCCSGGRDDDWNHKWRYEADSKTRNHNDAIVKGYEDDIIQRMEDEYNAKSGFHDVVLWRDGTSYTFSGTAVKMKTLSLGDKVFVGVNTAVTNICQGLSTGYMDAKAGFDKLQADTKAWADSIMGENNAYWSNLFNTTFADYDAEIGALKTWYEETANVTQAMYDGMIKNLTFGYDLQISNLTRDWQDTLNITIDDYNLRLDELNLSWATEYGNLADKLDVITNEYSVLSQKFTNYIAEMNLTIGNLESTVMLYQGMIDNLTKYVGEITDCLTLKGFDFGYDNDGKFTLTDVGYTNKILGAVPVLNGVMLSAPNIVFDTSKSINVPIQVIGDSSRFNEEDLGVSLYYKKTSSIFEWGKGKNMPVLRSYRDWVADEGYTLYCEFMGDDATYKVCDNWYNVKFKETTMSGTYTFLVVVNYYDTVYNKSYELRSNTFFGSTTTIVSFNFENMMGRYDQQTSPMMGANTDTVVDETFTIELKLFDKTTGEEVPESAYVSARQKKVTVKAGTEQTVKWTLFYDVKHTYSGHVVVKDKDGVVVKEVNIPEMNLEGAGKSPTTGKSLGMQELETDRDYFTF